MSYTAIVVDDEKIILDGLVHTYDWAGQNFEVIGSAGGGLAAYELIKEKKPDMVMTDICMKDIDGIELIRRVNQLGLGTIFVVISAYRDFDYAKQACNLGAFTYLLKPFNSGEFSAALASVRSVIDKNRRQRYGERILETHKSEIIGSRIRNFIEWGLAPDLFAGELRLLNADIGEENDYCAVCADISEPEGDGLFPGNRELLLLLLQERLTASFSLYKTGLDGDRLLLVLYGDKNRLSSPTGILSEIAEEFDEEGKTLYACHGEVLSGLDGLLRSCHQAAQGMEYTYENSVQTILPYTKIGLSQPGISLYPESSQQKIFKAIMQTDLELLAQGTAEFADLLFRSGCSRAFKLNCYYRISFSTQFFFISVYGEEGEISRRFEAFQKSLPHLGQGKSHLEYRRTVEELLSILDKAMTGAVLRKKDQYMDEALRFIDENLSDCELSVLRVAQELHLNPIYFGRIFKNLTGKSFREFLMTRRLAKARLLLETGSDSITDICFAVGMNSLSYFSTAFKKQFGILPSEVHQS